MNGYKAFYNGKTIEVYAASSYAAQCKAAEVLKVKSNKQYKITVVLCEDADGSDVLQSTQFI